MDSVKVGSSNRVVLDSTASKVRTFLYELAEGTSNYRSLHSLTEQVEHQYHGRFVLELLQNAHDALFPLYDERRSTRHIEISLRNEGEFGALYVANDGQPFSKSNFDNLSQLGQSDKDPQESIGNKGIGFRSVLEITKAPEIFSRSSQDSRRFDGFCFGFSPEVIGRLSETIFSLLEGHSWDTAGKDPFLSLDWPPSLIEKFRRNTSQAAATKNLTLTDWLLAQMSYLSPYLLPFPLSDAGSVAGVAEYERRGFATVIRLPLKDLSTKTLVAAKIEELDQSALLFLERASLLILDSGLNKRELSRTQETNSLERRNGTEVEISQASQGERFRYRVWTRQALISEAPEEVQAAVKALPGKWPKLKEISVSIAVSIGDEPARGIISVVLPTLVQTGCGAHISAAFFAEMSRRDIDFGRSTEVVPTSDAIYNRFLLLESARLAVFVVHEELAGGNIADAQAIVDLLAPFGSDTTAIERWHRLTIQATSEIGLNVKTGAWFLSDDGWSSISDVALCPVLESPQALLPQVMREHAAFPPYIEDLDSRRTQIRNLARAHSISPDPTQEELAETVESIALALHSNLSTDWNGFWADTGLLFDGNLCALASKRVLLGNDGELHSGGSEAGTVFFVPRKGSIDDDEVENEGDIKEIPLSLRPYVAFLNENIQVNEEKNGRLQNTRIRRLLFESKLVSHFRREDILNDVLLARTPPLPIPLDATESQLCSDILVWGLRLTADIVGRGQADASVRVMKKIVAPCEGGWYPLGDVAFGADWPGTHGNVTLKYLTLAATTEAQEAHQRLLLPPSHPSWADEGLGHLTLLRALGVFDGLSLTLVNSKDWPSRFQSYNKSFLLPPASPPGMTETFWNAYRSTFQKDVHPAYNSGTYEVQRLYTVPGIDRYGEFDDETRAAFMDVLLASAGGWQESWEMLNVNRILGSADCKVLASPLRYWLEETDWIRIDEDDAIAWFKPSERWHVSALELGRGRKWQFAHLKPLPGELADRLDKDIRLASLMHRLGMPSFNPEAKSDSTQLLDALADAVQRGDVPHRDVFLGQVRSAWRGFYPLPSSRFPKFLLVEQTGSGLLNVVPSPINPVCLPDSKKAFHALKHFEVPVIAIEPEDAKRLADEFIAGYPGAIIRTSELRPEPLVNGESWIGNSPTHLREESTVAWMIPLLLTISAFHGPQSQGTNSKAFRKQLDALRDARLSVVEQIETGLFRDGVLFARPLPVPALWVGARKTLLITQAALSDTGSLSDALSDLLDREDLEVAVRLMLETTGSQPEHPDILRALDRLKLSEQHFLEVRELWRGDLGQTIEMLIPLLSILCPAANIGSLVEMETESAVADFVNRLGDTRLNGESIMQLAHDSSDMYDFGRSVYFRLGAEFQLAKWNAALASRGEPSLANDDAVAEFRTHLISALPILRCLLAAALRDYSEVLSFRIILDQLENLLCPPEFTHEYWEVSFQETMGVTAAFFQEWLTPSDQLIALRECSSIDDLRRRLENLGVDVQYDPLQVARDNAEKLQTSLRELQQIGLAWALENRYPTPGDWEIRAPRYFELLKPEIESRAFKIAWTDRDIFSLIQKLPQDDLSAPFWESVVNATDLPDLVVRLGLSTDSLHTAQDKLKRRREEASRKRQIVSVCGKEFDGVDDNFQGLWGHICSALPESALDEFGLIDLQDFAPLVESVGHKKKPRNNPTPTPRAKRQYMSKALEALVGLTGEVHAFRMLQKTYGPLVVTPSSWVSENSLHVYPDNKASDALGYDFSVALPGRIYRIEVKSSIGEDQNFILGSSEISLALALARKTRRRREAFLIMHVSNALSLTPSFRLLPNPYDSRYGSLFIIDDASARVRYTLGHDER